jgi:hypothetical protein
MSPRLYALSRRPLFTVEGLTYCWGDVLEWANARGTISELRQTTRRALAYAARAAELGEPVDQEDVSAAARSFRYARRLLTAEELADWLRQWDLTVQEWGRHLERCLLLERWTDGAGPLPGDDPDVVEAEYVDIVCSGLLEREAGGFAADTALALLTPIEAAGDRTVMVERTLTAAALARASVASGPVVEREIASRRLDWTRLELDMLELGTDGAAREAALCIRQDGRTMADVAALSRASFSHLSTYVADLEPSLQPVLLAAQPGELVGPIGADGSFLLLAVTDRTPATADDPELRRRAEDALVERAVKRAIDGRVEWHEHL